MTPEKSIGQFDMSACDMAQRLRSGELSAREVALACLQRVEARDLDVRAWAHVDRETILAQAREIDGREVRGPLHGLPVGIKDTILTKDMPTEHNSPIYRGSRPGIDAACVSLLRTAGALIFGKTDTVEFASTGRVPLTRNPRALSRTPGGSSSGSAAAVADFQVPLALGTQTGGSIIRPASFCGVYAMKPTWGLVSFEGARSSAPSLDTIGWFGRSVADLALLYEVFDAEQAPFPALDLATLRIGVCRSPAWPHAEDATRDALAEAVARLRGEGARVDELELPGDFERTIDMHGLIMRSEGRSSFLSEYRACPALLHENIRGQVENSGRLQRDDLCRAYDDAAVCRGIFDRWAGEFDAIVTPSAVGEAPLGLDSTGSFVFNATWTLLHVPCVNLAGLTGPSGLPVGISVIGPRFADRRVLAAAARIETLLTR